MSGRWRCTTSQPANSVKVDFFSRNQFDWGSDRRTKSAAVGDQPEIERDKESDRKEPRQRDISYRSDVRERSRSRRRRRNKDGA